MLKLSKSLAPLSVFICVLFLSATVGAQSPGIRHITLDEAKAHASAATPAALAQLGPEAARYHRQAIEAEYFPKIDSTFTNLHTNKFMGQTVQLPRRDLSLPLFDKDITIAAVTLTQPVTPLLKIRQAVNIARADEEIAKAKSAQLSAQITNNVERVYFGLLVAQRQHTAAAIRVAKMTEDGRARLESGIDLIATSATVSELTRTLNALLGFAIDTELDLAAPEPVADGVSLQMVTQQALANSPEVAEAEQTVTKARAATRLSKLEYVPDVAVVGGYVYQTLLPILPTDFSYLGVMASFTLFDFGKREKTVSESRTQLKMAEANVDLVKTKVAASAQKAVLDLQRSRQIRDLTRQLLKPPDASPGVRKVALESDADQALAEAQMFQAELDYRQAYSQLKLVMEGQ